MYRYDNEEATVLDDDGLSVATTASSPRPLPEPFVYLLPTSPTRLRVPLPMITCQTSTAQITDGMTPYERALSRDLLSAANKNELEVEALRAMAISLRPTENELHAALRATKNELEVEALRAMAISLRTTENKLHAALRATKNELEVEALRAMAISLRTTENKLHAFH